MAEQFTGNTVTLAVDSGKDTTKVSVLKSVKRDDSGKLITETEETCFKTRVEEYNGLHDAITGINHVTYNGKQYVYGDKLPNSTTDTKKNSKADINHQLCTLIAIAKNVKNGDTVNIVIGCPIQIYGDKAKRNEYLDYIVKKGVHELIVDGEKKYFHINTRMCMAESTGIVCLMPEIFSGKNVGILDVGGTNVNGAMIQQNILNPAKCFTTQDGYYKICRNLSHKLESALDMDEGDIDPDTVDAYVNEGFVEGYEDVTKKVISDYMAAHLNEIIESSSKHDWNKLIKLVFVGGTSLRLKPYIESNNSIKNRAVVIENASFANAKGFLIGFTDALVNAGKIELN